MGEGAEAEDAIESQESGLPMDAPDKLIPDR
jgi:hypothetical protein